MRLVFVPLLLLLLTSTTRAEEPKLACPRGTMAVSERGDHSDPWFGGYGELRGCKRKGKLEGDAVIDGGNLLTRGRFAHGKRTGTWETWWRSGKRAGQIHYRDGIAHGPAASWLEDGRQSESGQYRKGVMSGTWTYYLDGSPSNRINYDQLHPLGVACPPRTTGFRRRLEGNAGVEVHWCERAGGVKHGPLATYDLVNDAFVIEQTYRDGIATK